MQPSKTPKGPACVLFGTGHDASKGCPSDEAFLFCRPAEKGSGLAGDQTDRRLTRRLNDRSPLRALQRTRDPGKKSRPERSGA